MVPQVRALQAESIDWRLASPSTSPSSACFADVVQEELPVLEGLINIRNRLTALKKDTTKFIRAQDVISIYNAVVKQGESMPFSDTSKVVC